MKVFSCLSLLVGASGSDGTTEASAMLQLSVGRQTDPVLKEVDVVHYVDLQDVSSDVLSGLSDGSIIATHDQWTALGNVIDLQYVSSRAIQGLIDGTITPSADQMAALAATLTTTTTTTTSTVAASFLAGSAGSVTQVTCMDQTTSVSAFSVDMYITENSFRSGERFYASQWTNDARGWAIRINKGAPGGPFMEFFVTNGGWSRAAIDVSDSLLPSGVEFRLTATYDGSLATIYIDGVKGQEAAHFKECCGMSNPRALAFSDAPDAQLCIGRDCRSSNGDVKDFDFTTGQIRDFSFYSEAMTF